jgi:D-alanyl-D-alanine carboxypeptidase
MKTATSITAGPRRRQHWSVTAAFLVTLLSAVAFAAERLPDVAFDELRITVQAELDARYAAAQNSNELFPGATLAFGLPDDRIAKFAVGFSDVEKKLPMRPESRMPAGSIGKTYVAAVALDMVDDGLLDLDGRIERWLGDEPWFSRLPNANTITLRHLLNHSSGIMDHVFDADSQFQNYLKEQLSEDDATRRFDPRDMVRFVLDREPLFPAGGGFHYTDTGYLLVGMIIEKASRSSYYEELARRLLVPLNLGQTTPLDRRVIAGIAQGYAPESQRLFGLPDKVVANGALVFDPSLEWTGGGLVTVSGDLVRWAIALFSGKAIGQPQVNEMLHSIAAPDHYADDQEHDYGYGLGVNVAHTALGVAYRHGGFFPGYNSILAYFPDTGIAVAMQINTDQSNIEGHFEAIAEIIIRALARDKSNVVGQR